MSLVFTHIFYDKKIGPLMCIFFQFYAILFNFDIIHKIFLQLAKSSAIKKTLTTVKEA